MLHLPNPPPVDFFAPEHFAEIISCDRFFTARPRGVRAIFTRLTIVLRCLSIRAVHTDCDILYVCQ